MGWGSHGHGIVGGQLLKSGLKVAAQAMIFGFQCFQLMESMSAIARRDRPSVSRWQSSGFGSSALSAHWRERFSTWQPLRPHET
jgi:hypothetical protein